MNLEISGHVEKIFQTQNHNLTHHLWLQGFSFLVENKKLNTTLANLYIFEKMSKHPNFTKLSSGNFLMGKTPLMRDDKLYSVHLPITDFHHLNFYLTGEMNWTFLFDECKGRCRVLEPYNFPHFELRKSVKLESNDAFIFHDNSERIWKQEPKLIVEGYQIVKELVDYSEI